MEPIRIAHDVDFHTKYGSYKADIYLGKYQADESYALVVTEVDQMAGGVICTPTYCLIEYDKTPQEDHVWVGNYAQNEGIREELVRLGIVEEVSQRFEIHTGASWSLCKLLKKEAV